MKIILFSVVVLVIVICIGMKKHNELVDSGEIITRRSDFMKNAEEFTLSSVNSATVDDAVRRLSNSIGINMRENNEKQIYNFFGKGWAAQLFRVSGDDTKVVYRFEFTSWQLYKGMPQDGLNMNRLATAVEKMFLGFDSNTRVREVQRELKTKHSIL